jgi:hypothetical protein
LSRSVGVPRIVRRGEAFHAEPWTGPPPAGGWGAALALFASEDPAAPAMLGSYRLEDDALTFTPRFSPAPAVRLRAVFQPPGAEPVIAWFGGVPTPVRAPSTRIVSITPSADIWPENILRLYLTFSAPMRLGVAWRHIRVLDPTGRPMDGMFVEIEQELWDPEGRRLTVLFDPARIKRGLVDHINEGPPLSVGQTCTLEIDAAWRDAAGGPLVEGALKAVTVAPPLRAPIEPEAWRLTPPTWPIAPLVVDAAHPLDAALALRALSVWNAAGEVSGQARLERSETRYVFTPDRPWTAGRHTVRADPLLEDIAGNRIGRPFDIDRAAPGQRDAVAHGAEIAFEV